MLTFWSKRQNMAKSFVFRPTVFQSFGWTMFACCKYLVVCSVVGAVRTVLCEAVLWTTTVFMFLRFVDQGRAPATDLPVVKLVAGVTADSSANGTFDIPS